MTITVHSSAQRRRPDPARLPSIAQDPASGTTTCVFTTPVVNDSATIVLQILQNTSTCVDGSCAVQCTERDPE